MKYLMEPGKTYMEDQPFRAPETVMVFKCVAVADHPTDASMAPFAFGFGTPAHPGDSWRSSVVQLYEGSKWVRCDLLSTDRGPRWLPIKDGE
jgi:hypothetical protein